MVQYLRITTKVAGATFVVMRRYWLEDALNLTLQRKPRGVSRI